MLSTVAGVIIGGLLGYFLPDFMLSISFIGQLFVNALRIVLIPVIVAAVIVGVTAMVDLGRLNRATVKALYYFLSTSLIAVVIGLILALILQPGVNVSIDGAVPPARIGELTSLSLPSILGSILPADMADAVRRGQFLWLVIASIFFGAVLVSAGERGKVVVDFFRSLNDAMLRLVKWLLYVAPLGLLSLVATAVASSHFSLAQITGSLGLFSLAVLAGLVLHSVVVLPLILRFLGGRSIGSFFSTVSPAIATAFGTASPAAALPMTFECATERGKVDSRAGAITLPLGAMINMNGTAIYAIIAALFCIQAANADLSIVQIVVLALSVVIVSIGTSLLPQGSVLILGVVLYAAGVPMLAYAGIGLLVFVDWFFDRLRAAVDVWGDAVGAAVVGNTFDFKTARRVKPPVTTMRRDRAGRRGGGTKRKEAPRSRPSGPQAERPQAQPDRDSQRQRGRKENRRHSTGKDRRKPPRQRPREDRPEPTRARGESENREKKFVMPPVPYHVLETELKSKPRPEPAEAAAGQADRAAVPSETLERERAKVAAQLDRLRAKDEPGDRVEDIKTPSDAVDETAEKSSSFEESRASFPKIDFYSNEKSQNEESRDEDAVVEQNEVSSEPSSTQPVSYGRGKQRRGPAVKPTSPGEPPAAKEETEKPEFSSENISFGRSKKKKPGQ